tara:strand:- start:2761 stop:4143 length:1383 start_codon:yes stop_codon:yes gene_type:complete
MKISENFPNHNKCTIAIIGMGYVGLPLAVQFAKSKKCLVTKKSQDKRVIGFDLNNERIQDLKQGFDKTKEISKEKLEGLKNIIFTSDINFLSKGDVFIITVPTPIDKDKNPDLKAIISASEIVGLALKKRLEDSISSKKKSSPVVIFESTVYPGTTEEVCVPILENESGLEYNNKEIEKGFFCGYSPERINPSDKVHTLNSITKVTSGGCLESSMWIDLLYGSVIEAGTYNAPSIKVAEAAKVIENTQRDLNIALINEFAIIFNKIGIDTRDVLETAGTKWNFLKFEPGLVGGHCISVDPYYLTFKSKELGYYPEVVLAGRKINDNMSAWVADRLKERLNFQNGSKQNCKVLILGFAFKENCVDVRNTKVIDIVNELKSQNFKVDVVDPWVNSNEVYEIYGIKILSELNFKCKYNAVLVAVGHNEFSQIKLNQWESLITKDGVFYDLKNIIPRSLNPMRL